ncbi:Isoleucine--tRNA ligase, cytoplasmic [Cyphellophora attinorum]|uniref:isoleucine--tRNA ligase n=1 Tax=Cyphellophora attinorum TaxID=1664694 RepID=A0A0N1GXB7_9EURO|nr:Isoleucine--tRNA ligase, cytoplasmic [Phialophora attinorum]KPI34893.1 Isoleucine--tRNA ligase, cytoplasmic [Phialophora attinorum]
MLRAPARQTATETIQTLSSRLQSATLLEDRRAAIQGLRSFAKLYPASVASGGLRDLVACLRRDADDLDTIKIVLETLLGLFDPDANSDEASEEITVWLADEFALKQDNVTALLDLLENHELYPRLYSLQILGHVADARPERSQEAVFAAPLGVSRIVSILDDKREMVRNEALLLLVKLTPTSGELQKVVAFEDAFGRIFAIIEAEGGLTHGATIDAVAEEESAEGVTDWLKPQRDVNVWGILTVIQMFVPKGAPGTGLNQQTFWQSGILTRMLKLAFHDSFSISIRSKALETCGDVIRSNAALQERFGDLPVQLLSKTQPPTTNGHTTPKPGANAREPTPKPKPKPVFDDVNVIEALLELALEAAPLSTFDVRLAACNCFKAFIEGHNGIRMHVLRRAIEGHRSGDDAIPNILTVLLEPSSSRSNADPYQQWMAAVILMHLLFDNPETKAVALKVAEGDADSGEEVVTFVQSIASNVIAGVQHVEDERALLGCLMLLCTWLFEDPDAVNDLLGEGTNVQGLIAAIKVSNNTMPLVSSLCSLLIGIVYEFSSKDSPVPRKALHSLLTGSLGRETYVDRMTRLRENPLVRDYEVLPQTGNGGLPDVFFDKAFIDFLKDNFSRLLRAIDRDPGFEVSVMSNGVQKGVSRDLVDGLRANLEEHKRLLEIANAELLQAQRKLEDEGLEHRRTRESTTVELNRIKQINQSLQSGHEDELNQMRAEHGREMSNLKRSHDEDLNKRRIDTSAAMDAAQRQRDQEREKAAQQIKAFEQQNSQAREKLAKEHERALENAAEVREKLIVEHATEINGLQTRLKEARGANEAELDDLKQQVESLRKQLDKAGQDHVQDLQTANEEYQTKTSNLKAQLKRAEIREKEAIAETETLTKKLEEAESSRKDVQTELDDLLVVFGDLEAKRAADKAKLKELGQGVSDDEDEEDGDDDDDAGDGEGGPPFATGLPHYGHLLASTIKDIIPRYWSSKGYYVERRFGWDTHGLPIEYEIDKKFNISGPAAVREMGIAQYNKECKAIVMRFASEWKTTIDRLGRWIDFENDYKTMNPTFMESVWWVFKQLFDKGQVYRSYRVMPFSTALSTPLSQHEAQSNYKDVQDPAVVVSFPLVEDPKTSFLAWTTTPWTLPSNVALAVHPEFEYIKFVDLATGNQYIMVEELLGTLYKDPKKAKFTILERIKGAELKGKKYEPLFPYFYDQFKDHGFKVLTATYVTKTDGTGIVHQAPSFGEDDYRVGQEHGVINADRLPPNPVDETGKFTKEVADFVGQHVKDADKNIIKHLKGTGRMIKDGQLFHSYPFCWRSDTPLIYRAISVALVPGFVKEKRFGDWIKNARDWNISRNRYWGTPIPLWANEDYSEIQPITDLHRDTVDEITIPSKKNPSGPPLRRIEEVFDCWFESGSMPYAQSHYPFEDKDSFPDRFPGDFIAEGLDQTRGWFYTLVILGIHLFGKLPFKNCVVNGIVLAEDGKKMSKRLKNYPDPMEVIEKYGADALRLYMINSPVVRAETLRFKEAGVKEIVTKVLLPLWNSYKFFEGQVELLKKLENHDFVWNPNSEETNSNVMDKWILASMQSLLKYINEEMAGYRLYTVVPGLLKLIDDTTNWYIRFNRKRLKGELGKEDTLHALNTLFDVLFTLVRGLAPFTPFIADLIYSKLLPYIPKSAYSSKDMRSVHFLPFPEVRESLFDEAVERRVARMQKVIELARQSRDRVAIGLKTPLKTLVVIHTDPQYLDDIRSLEGYITEELNIRDLVLSADEDKYNVQYSVSADWPVLGKKLKKDVQKVKKALPDLSSADCKKYLADGKTSVAGIELVEGDLVVKRALKESEDSKAQLPNSDNDVLTILDTAIYPELAQEALAREIVRRVNDVRKKAGLKPTDDVKMEYRVKEDPEGTGIEKAFEEQAAFIEKALRRPVDKHVVTDLEPEPGKEEMAKESVIMEVDQEVNRAVFALRLVRL